MTLDAEKRKQVIDSMELAFRSVGAQDLEDGFRKSQAFFGAFSTFFLTIGTRASFDDFLSKMEVPPEQEEMCVAIFASLPQLVGVGLQMFSEEMSKDFPARTAGRPKSLTMEKEAAVREYTLKLFGEGTPLGTAKNRAARHFGVSRATVERIWADRKKHARKPSVDELIEFLKSDV